MLLSHRKRTKNTICSNMDGPRDSYWTKQVRERQISYDIVYIWNLKTWYTWIYLQNIVTDVENKHGYQEGKWGKG